MEYSKTILASVLQFDQGVRERFEEAGIGVELSGFSLPEFLDDRALPLAKQVAKKWLNGFPNPVSMHGAFMNMQIMVRDPWLVDVCFRRYRQSLEIANELGIRHVVFHPNYIPSHRPDHKQTWLDVQVKFWEGLVPIAAEYGVVAHLENTTEPDASYLTEIVRRIAHPNLSTCFDTGHTHCFTQERVPLAEWVQGLGNDLTYIHLHSNNGRFDDHIAYTKGTLSFDGFWEAIETMSVPPWIIIEVKSKESFAESLEALQQRFGKPAEK